MHRIYRPFLRHFRARRVRLLYRRLNLGAGTRVLDIGGHSGFWGVATALGLPLPRVTIANVSVECHRSPDFEWLVADGRQLPFGTGAFDVTLSNSVIEHLGDVPSQARFASEIQRVGRRHFVQTPNRGFPVEPHLLTPIIHWLPLSWRRKLIRNCSVWGVLARPTHEQCLRFLDEVRLLDAADMRGFFPRSEVIREKTFGLTKSLIATGGDS